MIGSGFLISIMDYPYISKSFSDVFPGRGIFRYKTLLFKNIWGIHPMGRFFNWNRIFQPVTIFLFMFHLHFIRKLLSELSNQHLSLNILYSLVEIQIKKSIIWWSIWMNQSHSIVNLKFLIFRKIFEKVILTVVSLSRRKCQKLLQ